MEIKNVYDEVLLETKGSTLTGAYLTGANLHEADLRGAMTRKEAEEW